MNLAYGCTRACTRNCGSIQPSGTSKTNRFSCLSFSHSSCGKALQRNQGVKMLSSSRRKLQGPGVRAEAVPDARPVLSRDDAKRVYNKMAKKVNDTESAYGGPASERLIELARFEELPAGARVVEFGHGQGSFARRLFARGALPAGVRYLGVDQSTVMHEVARAKLEPYRANVELRLTDGDPSAGTAGLAGASVDAFVSTFVLDLLCEADLRLVLQEAKRLLKPSARLSLTGITYGDSPSSSLASFLWEAVYTINRELVGGCRPQLLVPYVEEAGFVIEAHQVVQGDRRSLLGLMNSEVVVAKLLQ